MKTISDEYRKLNEELHRSRADYGCKSHRHAGVVMELVEKVKAVSVLDYGCGKGALVRDLQARGVWVQGWDPCVREFAGFAPGPADVVVCTDVLEHIEPECLDAVLAELETLARRAVYLVIALRPDSSKLLPDGTNPHKIVENEGWWMERLRRHFPARRWDFGACCVVVGKVMSLEIVSL